MHADGRSIGPLPFWARIRERDGALVLTLYVQPNARNTEPVGRHGDALKVRVAAPASEQRANEALLQFLHQALGIPRSGLRIARGTAARLKVVEISAPRPDTAARLRAWSDR